MGWRRAIELRAEIFNLLNILQFGAPAIVLGAPDSGTITSAFDLASSSWQKLLF